MIEAMRNNRSTTTRGSSTDPDPSAALVAEFNALAISKNLTCGSKKYIKLRRNYVTHEWNVYFGDATALENWQRLCDDLDIQPIPQSITQCKKALKRVWVNIYDFLDAMATGNKVKHWKSQGELARYTIQTNKIYPKKQAKENGPVRALLAHIFSN